MVTHACYCKKHLQKWTYRQKLARVLPDNPVMRDCMKFHSNYYTPATIMCEGIPDKRFTIISTPYVKKVIPLYCMFYLKLSMRRFNVDLMSIIQMCMMGKYYFCFKFGKLYFCQFQADVLKFSGAIFDTLLQHVSEVYVDRYHGSIIMVNESVAFLCFWDIL